MNDVTFIIVNRGGTELQRVIDNFEKTFNKFFSKVCFIVVEQYDNLPFKRGQLYNIGVKFCNTEYIGLIDNDIINIDVFNPIEIYNTLGGPYIAFDVITQIKYTQKDKYEILFSEKRLSGFGAFNFMKKEDFIKANGFSNLCIGWGAEDNILNIKIKFKRFEHSLGHINHPRRLNNEPECTDNNKKIYKKYQARLIDGMYDGYVQTIFNLIENKIEGNVTYIKVNNIRVLPGYKYLNEYNVAKSIESKYVGFLDGYSICVTIYKEKEYIKETLDSIFEQTWFKKHKNWEVILGIDGCTETLEYVQTIMNNYNGLKVYMMDSNKGTYITTNTIMKLAKYDKMIRFDSDDIMLPDTIEQVDNRKKDYDYINLGFICFGYKENGRIGVANGCVMITKDAFELCGGYQPWICAADLEIKTRLEKMVKCYKIADPLYKRRIRYDGLQYSNETGMKSEIREKYHEYIKTESSKHLEIPCVVNTCKEIKQNGEKVIVEILNKDVDKEKIRQKINAKKTVIKPTLVKTNRSFDFDGLDSDDGLMTKKAPQKVIANKKVVSTVKKLSSEDVALYSDSAMGISSAIKKNETAINRIKKRRIIKKQRTFNQ